MALSPHGEALPTDAIGVLTPVQISVKTISPIRFQPGDNGKE
jgi:hypothetical protein